MQPANVSGAVECDELYMTPSRGRNNSLRIKRLGGEPRCRGLKKRGGEEELGTRIDLPFFILVERGVGRIMFS
ncbi:MAG: hypothetical protein KIH10_13335 [Candidatus Freyarchaeota archaeon]|nr:hypothetical protein [Candidatus Jordarchaeia archaeon]MBS7280067.1 hypothetical protein [Candidatus Jordarchaeia archaeon]